MRIALSSAAAPRATLQELVDGCTRRGLTALHLVASHGHGIALGIDDRLLDDALELTHAAGVTVAAYEIDADADRDAALRICHRFGALLVVRDSAHAIGTVVLDCTREDVALAAQHHFARQSVTQHFILRGAGPEAAQHEGRGIGGLMALLALRGYTGTVALEPSSKAVGPVWRAWLNHGRNWGCGSKTAESSLVTLA